MAESNKRSKTRAPESFNIWSKQKKFPRMNDDEITIKIGYLLGFEIIFKLFNYTIDHGKINKHKILKKRNKSFYFFG